MSKSLTSTLSGADRPVSLEQLTSPARVREALSGLDLKPSRAMGQNFLVDANVLRILLETARLDKNDNVLEVGPGLGVVTCRLLGVAANVVAVEKDRRLAEFLATRLGERSDFRLLCADVLDADIGELLASGFNKVVSNLPYSVGSRVLVDLAQSGSPPERIVVTVQEEVARRLAAHAGASNYGLLSVRMQLAYDVRIVKKVSPTCFWPIPQVGSMIVDMAYLPRFTLDSQESEMFRALTKTAFSHRRKQMTGILAKYGPGGGMPADQAAELLRESGIEPSTRPGDIEVAEWVGLARLLRASVRS